MRCTISRTGYTGEDGFEVFVPPASAERVWDAILDAGRGAGRRPGRAWARATRCGSRRRCASTATTWTRPRRSSRRTSGGLSAGRRPEFLGADVLQRQKAEGAPRKLVGFEMLDRAHRAARLRRLHRRRQERRRHERHADAVSEKSHRHGVRAARIAPRRAPSSTIDVRGRRVRGTRRPDAVLQAREIGSGRSRHVSVRSQVHQRSRVGSHRRRRRRTSASPTTRRNSSATSSISNCPTSGARSTRARSSARSNRSRRCPSCTRR